MRLSPRLPLTTMMSLLFGIIVIVTLASAFSFQRVSLPNVASRMSAKIVDDAEDYQIVSLDHGDYKGDYPLRVGAGLRIEQSPSLVLNADYTPLSHLPLSLWSWQDTLRAVFSGKAVVVSEYSDLIVRSVSCSFALPSVIALTTYQKVPSQIPVMSRRNLYIRDGFKCQVCAHLIDIQILTYGLIVPE